MVDRRVKRAGKDEDGDITSICGDWGNVTKATAITDLTPPVTNTCFVQDGLGRRADVQVVNGPTGKYLRTDPNSNCSDNLDNLPDC
jgi:hypothetical protein